MNSAKPLGIVLITLGILMMLYTGIHYYTTERVVDIGSLHINKEKNHFISWPPLVGAVLLVSGLAMFFIRKKA